MPYLSRIGHFFKSLNTIYAMHTTFTDKNTTNQISYQVRQILNEKGYSFLFNWSDYSHFKSQVKNAFNKAQAIAELFIQETEAESDYNEYTF